MIIRMLSLALITEALVELFFKAAPLQGIRFFLIKKTPSLRSDEQGHMLECKYCVSIWIGAAVYIISTIGDYRIFRIAGAALIVARMSNYLHILYSTARDAQINMRLKR